jgi:uncharacterized protein
MAGLLALLLAFYLIAISPVRGARNFEAFRQKVRDDPSVRVRMYEKNVRRKCLLACVAILVWIVEGCRSVGIPILATKSTARTAVIFGASLAVGSIALHVRLRSAKYRAKLGRVTTKWVDLLPRTAPERRTFVAFAICAGVTEEILYRGFMLAYLHRLSPQADGVTIVLVAALAFGLAHLYQGPRGVAITTIVGFVLGVLAIDSGLLFVIALHALVDLRLLQLPPAVVDDIAALGSAPQAGAKGTTS